MLHFEGVLVFEFQENGLEFLRDFGFLWLKVYGLEVFRQWVGISKSFWCSSFWVMDFYG